MIAVVDYGRGNLGSVEKAFGRVGIPARVTDDPRVLDDAEACVLPGDGAFRDAMQNLDTLGLLGALRRALDGRRPFLGICLGYQLLFTESEEFGQTKGLDVVTGVVHRFPRGLKVPHMGWNQVAHVGDLRLFDGCDACNPGAQLAGFADVVHGGLAAPRARMELCGRVRCLEHRAHLVVSAHDRVACARALLFQKMEDVTEPPALGLGSVRARCVVELDPAKERVQVHLFLRDHPERLDPRDEAGLARLMRTESGELLDVASRDVHENRLRGVIEI